MPGRIYLLDNDGKTLRSLEKQPYDSEDLLQELLGEHPDLLAGDQIDEATPRRWLLVDREVGVPIKEDAAGGMLLDHLFLDQDGVPTLVEVKRSSDTRIRREVVGQMLDYAAHAVAYWSVEMIRSRFETRCEDGGDDPDQLVAQLISPDLDEDVDVEAFWGQVKTSLQAGRIRLIFVADEIPPELRRVVEFLNRFMDPVEVLAVEVAQYVGEGLKTLVPRVIGQTAKASRPRRQWDEPSFFRELEAQHGADVTGVARRLLEWAVANVTRVWWGKGKRSGSFVPILNYNGQDHQLMAVWTNGGVEIYFQWYQYKPPFDSEERRQELLSRLNAIEGVALPDDCITRRPGIPLAVLADETRLEQFLELFDWVVQEIQAT